MSDLDDLKKLQERLETGRITKDEYERERAWILGTAADEAQQNAAAARDIPASGHVLDLHEIEKQEKEAEQVIAARKEPRGPQKTADKGNTVENKASGSRIPTVWKAIFLAFAIWILLLVTAVVWMNLQRNTAQESAGTNAQAGSDTAQSAAQDIRETAADTSYETFLTQLESILGTYYNEAYSITDDGKVLTISLTGDGIAEDAVYVVEGADGAAEVWEALRASMRTLAVTCFDGANADAPERHVVLNILNDQNEENLILSYLDGECIYDATQE